MIVCCVESSFLLSTFRVHDRMSRSDTRADESPALLRKALDKPNQDSLTIIPAFSGDESKVFFGVFDGHGTTGDLCATFVKKECPERLIKILEKKNSSFLEAYSKSFEDTNAKLHASRIDDSLSGTTAICMFLDSDMIHVANVGDSRAVIATMSDGKLVAQPLSVDQTPYRSVRGGYCSSMGEGRDRR